MGCVNNYCSNGSIALMPKDKKYTATIISNMLTNQIHSYKINNKFLNSERQLNDNIDNTSYSQTNKRKAYSTKELKIPENPLPFVKVKPKKINE